MSALACLPLAAVPQALPTLARWFALQWPDYYAGRSLAEVEADFPLNDDLPHILIALRGGVPVGTAALRAGSIRSHAHLTPWLGGLLVAPEARRSGVASALIAAVESEARRRGFDALHAGTVEAHPLFEALGWSRIGETEQDGQPVTVFLRRL